MARFDTGDRFDRMVVRDAVRRLGSVKCSIIFLKYGIQCHAHTDAEVRGIMKLSKKEYNRLLERALEELKENLSDYSRGHG